MAHRLQLVVTGFAAYCFALLAVLAPGMALAGYAKLAPPSGVLGSGSLSSITVKASANMPWVNGSAAGGATINVGGRAITVPVSLRVAANAGSILAPLVRATPAALAVAGVASVLAPLVWDAVQSRWEVEEQGTPTYTCLVGGHTGHACSSAGAIEHLQNHQNYSTSAGYTISLTGTTYPSATSIRWQFRINRNGSFWANVPVDGTQVQEQPVVVEREATEADWQTIADKPPCYGATDIPGGCWGDPLMNPNPAFPEGVGVPVELPKLNPDAVGIPRPLRVPMGDPVPVPGTSPQEYKQPVVDIVPTNTPAEPWRVDLQPKEVIGQDPEGLQEPTPVGGSDPVGTPVPEAAKTDCELFPEASGCKPLGTASDPGEIATTTIPLEISPVSGFGPSTAACPAPRSLALGIGSFELSWQPFCDFASGVRPFVVAFAWISAVFAWVGLGRKE